MFKQAVRGIALENEIPEEPFVFLGGTCNNSEWRSELISLLTVAYFDPIVEDWTEGDAQNEENAKHKSKAILYVITPKQSGTYALVEMAVTACKNVDKKVVIVFLKKDEGDQFDEDQTKSNNAVKDLLTKNTNAEFFTTLKDAAAVLNEYVSTFNNTGVK